MFKSDHISKNMQLLFLKLYKSLKKGFHKVLKLKLEEISTAEFSLSLPSLSDIENFCCFFLQNKSLTLWVSQTFILEKETTEIFYVWEAGQRNAQKGQGERNCLFLPLAWWCRWVCWGRPRWQSPSIQGAWSSPHRSYSSPCPAAGCAATDIALQHSNLATWTGSIFHSLHSLHFSSRRATRPWLT